MTDAETSSPGRQAGPGLVGRILVSAPIGLAAGAGVAVWLVFRPGFLDGDGSTQLQIASTGLYHDWYSPLMALAFACSMKAGSQLGAVTLIQAVLGAVGVYAVASEALRFLGHHRWPEWLMRWGAVAVLALLLTPFTPLMYYLAHFRNDSLAAFFLAWAMAGWLHVDRAWNRQSARYSRRWKLGLLIPPALFSILLVMIRYNAVVVLPCLCLLVALILGRTSRPIAATMVVLLLLAPTVLHECLLRATHAERKHPEKQIMGIELVGMCVESDGVSASYLSYTRKHLLPGRFPGKYVPGCVWSVYCGAEEYLIVDRAYLEDFARLKREFRRAIRKAPVCWLTVKAKAAAASLFDQGPHWHHRVIDPNSLGIKFSDELRTVRTLILDIDAAIFADPVLRFLCARHLPWLVLNVLLVLVAGIAACLTRSRRSALIAAVVIVPLAYYISHLLAVAAHDYRYMFPATLLMQVLVACLALQVAATWMEAHVARALLEHGDQRRTAGSEEPDGESTAATSLFRGTVKRRDDTGPRLRDREGAGADPGCPDPRPMPTSATPIPRVAFG